MKKIFALLLALAMVLSMAACGNDSAASAGSAPAEAAGSEAAAPAAEGSNSELSVCLASEPDTLDPALNSTVDGATLTAHLFSGLAKWAQDASGKLVIVADAATELPEGVVNDDGTVTYTYTLRHGLTWSDG